MLCLKSSVCCCNLTGAERLLEEEDEEEAEEQEEDDEEDTLPLVRGSVGAAARSPLATKLRIKPTPLGLANRQANGGSAPGLSAGAAKASASKATSHSFASGWGANGGNKKAAWSKAATAASWGEPFQRVFLEPPAELPEADWKVTQYLREELQITVSGEDEIGIFPPLGSFEELEDVIPQYVLDSLASFGIASPMPIQSQALPLALGGQDLIGIAKTGSGKTLAYLLPAIVHIEAQEPLAEQAATPIVLILVPVRELAVQIAEEAQKLLKGSAGGGNHPNGIWAACAYGGGSGSKSWQVAEIKKGGHIVAATPGRLVDLVDSGEVGLDRVTYFVLDEADRMLEEGFGDQVGSIAAGIRPDRQTVFFSATWPAAVQELAERMCGGGAAPALVTVGQQDNGGGPTSREDIVQEVVVFDEGTWEERDAKKKELLYAHLSEILGDPAHKALVFVSRKDLADELGNVLWKEGVNVNTMHGGKSQDRRLEVLDEFKKGDTKLLVTTDVMGRGLDIPDVSHVVVYDMGDIEDYVHRIGRTARGPYGEGHALTFFEYDRKWPSLGAELIQVLERSGQEAPAELHQIVSEVESGLREVHTGGKKSSVSSWGSSAGWVSSKGWSNSSW
mmetsp:Transcript_149311/g.479462  ORF Transcript_149311/g.479462 Transcript_149311/m.479462 type:complete len:619 (+) Transcript_149311:12-1868(+)